MVVLVVVVLHTAAQVAAAVVTAVVQVLDVTANGQVVVVVVHT